MTRYNYQQGPKPQIGGKIGIKKAFGKVDDAFHNKKFVGTMKDVGKFAENQILPTVVSTAIPLASTALGALATTYGGPLAGEMVSNLSSNLMEQYIPDKYQSDNPYVGMLGDALSMGASGEIDPYQLQQLQGQFAGQVMKDITPKQPQQIPMNYPIFRPPPPPPPIDYESLDYTNNFQARPNINISLPKPVEYTPENPYQDIMIQLLKNMGPQGTPNTVPSSSSDGNSANDAIYGNAELGKGSDSINNKISPYQQKEGSLSGLMGSGVSKYHILPYDDNKTGKGIKKPRGRPKKKIEEITKVEIIKKPRHKKFSGAQNTALDQLIEASEHKKGKASKKKFDEMVEKQIRMLTVEGY